MTNDTTADKAKSLAQNGMEHLKTASYDAALEAFAEAAGLYGEKGNAAAEASMRMIVADIYCATGQQSQALATYRRVETLRCAMDDSAGLAAAKNNIGLFLTRMKHHDEAMTVFSEAMQLFEACGLSDRAAEQLGNMGSVCRDKGESAQALDYYRQALLRFEQSGNRERMADQHANVAYIQAMDGEITSALINFDKARIIYEHLGHTEKNRQTVKNIELLHNR